MTVARSERNALCDLFVEVGPDAPTLCGDWTTRDLAAHLVVRERNLLGGTGIVVSALASFTEKGMVREAERPWDELVERVRTGPLWFGRPADALINTIEFFVHHEDVRRGDGTGEPRAGIDEVDAELWKRMRRMARLLTRRAPKGVGIDLVHPNGDIINARSGDSVARLVGTPGELTLFLFGRRAVAQVEVEGDEDTVVAVKHTDFSA